MPKRIQRKRAKGWRMPDGAVYVGRPGAFGNYWSSLGHSNEEAVRLYRLWLSGVSTRRALASLYGSLPIEAVEALHEMRAVVLARLPELRGKDLACWCRPGQPCHADVLLELANARSESAA
jgi:hypothetical protein